MAHMQERIKAWTKALMMIPGLSGYEGNVRRYIKAELHAMGLATRTDRLGNLIATIAGDDELPSVMFIAHMDQLGLIVRKIEANGLIRVERLGGVPEKALPAQEVLLCVGHGRTIPGVIANKSHHATTPEEKYKVDALSRSLHRLRICECRGNACRRHQCGNADRLCPERG